MAPHLTRQEAPSVPMNRIFFGPCFVLFVTLLATAGIYPWDLNFITVVVVVSSILS